MAAGKVKAAATPTKAATPPAAEEAEEESTGKAKTPSIADDGVKYVILLDKKKPVRAFCGSKEGVAAALESLSAKEREKAFVFQLTSVKLETKVSVVWE